MFGGKSGVGFASARRGRQSQFPSTLDPAVTQATLLKAYSMANSEESSSRYGKYGLYLNLAQVR